MAATSPTEIVRAFIAHVNDGDLRGIASSLPDTIMFIDAPGRVHRGDKNFMAGYLSEFPDYRIHARTILQSGDSVAVIGGTTGSHVPPSIEANETLVWTAEVREGLIVEWRIYADETHN
jgi:ketosteroid isomerase-like protein